MGFSGPIIFDYLPSIVSFQSFKHPNMETCFAQRVNCFQIDWFGCNCNQIHIPYMDRVSLRTPPSASLRAPPNASLGAPPTFLKRYPCVFLGIRRYLCDGSVHFPKPAYFITSVVTAALLLSISICISSIHTYISIYYINICIICKYVCISDVCISNVMIM